MPDSLTDKWQSMADARELWPGLSQATIDAMVGHAVHIDDGVTYISRMKMPEPFMPHWLEPSDDVMLCPYDDCLEPMQWRDVDTRRPANSKPYEHDAYRSTSGEYPDAWAGPRNADVRIDYQGNIKTLIGTPVAMQCEDCGRYSAILRRDKLHETSLLTLSTKWSGTPSDKLTSLIVRALECERVDCTCLDEKESK